MQDITNFLRVPTPAAWVEAAADNLDVLLIDHAHCEKKAASTAISFMFQYPHIPTLLQAMTQLAREELRHFSQVMRLIEAREIPYVPLIPARYARELRKLCRTAEPGRLVDVLIVGALIEARSCERFAAVEAILPTALSVFYKQLAKAESRHFHIYLSLAHTLANEDIKKHINRLVEAEARIILQPEADFRFHSGVPCYVTPLTRPQ